MCCKDLDVYWLKQDEMFLEYFLIAIHKTKYLSKDIYSAKKKKNIIKRGK